MNADNSDNQGDLSASTRSTRTSATPRLSLLACGLLLTGAATAVFVTGGAAQGALGIFLLCAGAVLTVCPPQRRISWPLWLAAAALAGCGALAFLPEHWFGVPGWRQALEAAPAIRLPKTVTPVPWTTAFWLAVLALSIMTGFCLLSHPVRSPSLLVFAVLGAIVCGSYAALAIYAKRTGWHYPFDGGATFGFFPNRNHTAVLLVTGSIVAMGVLGVTLRDGRWLAGMLAGASLAVCVVALFFYSSSRGGVLFLLVGVLLWVAGLGRARMSAPLLVTVGALAVAAMVLLLASGSEVRNRLLGLAKHPLVVPERVAVPASPGQITAGPPPAATGDMPLDFRILIWRDTRTLIRDFPLTGTGLGAFADDFAHYRSASLSGSLALHPESDWLMLTAEAGIPALLCAVALLVLVARRFGWQSDHPFWPLRWGCVVAAGTAVLHGAVDVPMHRVTLGWWLLVLAGLGLQTGSGRERGRSRFQHALFVAGGLCSLVLGTQLVRAEWFGAPALPPFAAERAPQEIIARFERQEAFEAMHMADQAVRVSPTSAPLYHLWGVLLLHFEDSNREVDQAFQAERLLNPNWPQIPLLQGDMWAVVDPKRTAALWLDAMDLQRRINRARTPAAVDDPTGYFLELLDRAQRWPGVAGELAVVASREPKLTLAWMERSDPATVREKLGQVLAEPGLANKFTATERQRLLLLWDKKGDRESLARFIEDQPNWQGAVWPLRLRQLAQAQRYEDAVGAVAKHYDVSLELPPSNSTKTTLDNGANAQDAVSMFNGYWREGNTVTARRILAEAANTVGSQVWAPEYWRLRAALAVEDKEWPLAWQHLERWVKATHPQDVMP